MKKSTVILLGTAMLLAAGAGVFVARATLDQAPAAVALAHGTALVPPQPLPEFALVAEDGRPFTRAGLENRWTLLFFGFTHCPDVCPTTLALLADVRKRLGDLPEGSRPEVALVSVDPARDTPEAMAGYVRGFDPSFRGITGSPAAIDSFTAALGIAHRKVPMGADQYMVDHTAAVFLIDPQARRTAVFSPPLNAADIASDYRAILASSPGRG